MQSYILVEYEYFFVCQVLKALSCILQFLLVNAIGFGVLRSSS